jgi:hypothetical protein
MAPPQEERPSPNPPPNGGSCPEDRPKVRATLGRPASFLEEDLRDFARQALAKIKPAPPGGQPGADSPRATPPSEQAQAG